MHAKKTNKTKLAVVLLALALLVGCAAGATLAWLIDTTDPITNTFTVGDINITLTESEDLDLKMVPGVEIKKDPVVTVKANSEECYLFVKIEESDPFPNFLQYSVNEAEGEWKFLQAGVYYRVVAASDTDQEFGVLVNDKVIVGDDATKENLAEYKNSKPTLTFTAYAVQKANVADAAEAWGYANP